MMCAWQEIITFFSIDVFFFYYITPELYIKNKHKSFIFINIKLAPLIISLKIFASCTQNLYKTENILRKQKKMNANENMFRHLNSIFIFTFYEWKYYEISLVFFYYLFLMFDVLSVRYVYHETQAILKRWMLSTFQTTNKWLWILQSNIII